LPTYSGNLSGINSFSAATGSFANLNVTNQISGNLFGTVQGNVSGTTGTFTNINTAINTVNANIAAANVTIASVQSQIFGNANVAAFHGNLNPGNIIVGQGSGSIIGGNLTVASALIGSNITTGNITVTGNTSVTGNITTSSSFFGDGSNLSNVAIKYTGSWSVPTGNSTQSFTVTPSNTYYMWVDCNIPNGILTWTATATVTNTNVPVVGAQYAWVYTGGGTPIDFTSIPNQFTGTANTIVRSSVAPSATTNRFDFGINNTSGNVQIVRYGWARIS
jgi:hypothetical protein